MSIRSGVIVLGVLACGAVYLQNRERPPAASDTNAQDIDTTEVPFENLRWTHRGPAPIPIETQGWNESGLRALTTRDGRAHVVLREPAEDGSGAVYALRPIEPTALGDPVLRHSGRLDRVVSGANAAWVVSAGSGRVLSWEFGASGTSTSMFSPADEHTVLAHGFWVRDGNLSGAVLTELPIYASDERPRREHFEEPGGGSAVRITGPRPTAYERWLTPVGGRARPVQIATDRRPAARSIDQSLVVGSAAGSAVLLFERPAARGLFEEGSSDTPTLQVVRFGDDGRELWRRRTPIPNRAFEPTAHLADDGTLEAAWRAESSIVHVTLSDTQPQPLRTTEFQGEIHEHALRVIRCGDQSWLFHLYVPRDERTVSRYRVEPSSLAAAEQVYQGTLSHDGPAPTGETDHGHHEWVAAYNGAHIHLELACNDTTVLVALDVPTAPTTSDRGLMLFD